MRASSNVSQGRMACIDGFGLANSRPIELQVSLVGLGPPLHRMFFLLCLAFPDPLSCWSYCIRLVPGMNRMNSWSRVFDPNYSRNLPDAEFDTNEMSSSSSVR
jgi:hypothetical protein